MRSVFAAIAIAQALSVQEFELKPYQRYPAIDGSLSISSIGALVKVQGMIFITQPTSGEVLIVKADDGKLLRTMRRGGGPGEFQVPTTAGVRGDTVWIADRRLAKVTLFDPSGAMLGTLTVPSGHEVVGLTPDGYVLALAPARRSGSGRPLLRFRRSGELRDTILTMRQSQSPMITAQAGGRYITFPNPFGTMPVALYDDRERSPVIISTDGRHGHEIEILRVVGGRQLIQTFGYPAVPVRVEDLQRLFSHFPIPFRSKDAIERMPLPKSWVPINQVVVAHNGDIWLGSEAWNQPVIWTIIDRGGRKIGTLRAPAKSRFHLIQGDTVWASEFGPHDEPHIVKYALAKKP